MLKAAQQALIKYSSDMFSYVWLYLAERFIVFSFREVLVVCEGPLGDVCSGNLLKRSAVQYSQ